MKPAGHLATDAYENAGHFVHFYDEDAPLVQRVADYVEQALRAGGSAVVIATAPHLAMLQDRLGIHYRVSPGKSSDGSDPDPGPLVLMDADVALAALSVDDWPDEQRFHSTVGAAIARAAARGGPVHAFGEMVGLLCERGRQAAALHLERLWSALGANYRFSLMCGYPRRLFPTSNETAIFQDICAAHTRVLPDDVFTNAPATDAFRLAALWRQKAGALEAEMLRRQRTERQRDDMLVNSPVASALLVGPEHRFWLANRAFQAMAGRDDLAGSRYVDVYPHEPRVMEGLGQVLKDGNPVVLEEYRGHGAPCTRDQGRIFTLHMNPLGSVTGQAVDSVMLTAIDETDHVLARERLENLHAERARLLAGLENASRAKDEFLAMLGHELRNPLAPIVTALELMQLHGAQGTSREQSIIRRQVGHLERLVDDLLDVSRIARGDVVLKKETVSICEVIDRAVEMAGPLLEQRGHRLDVEVAGDIACEADPARIAQVISNLLTNAARYTDAPGDIRVLARSEGGWITIQVRDNGIGMTPETLGRIFDTFYRGKPEDGRGAGGLGLGLALVKNLVELHGGRVHAQSDGRGRGSEFVVELPRGNAGPVIRQSHTLRGGVCAATNPPDVPRRVLVVDDSVDNALALAEWLRSRGHIVEALHDPAAALKAVPSFDPDIVVLDIGLPGMDGYELCRCLRSLAGGRPRTYAALTGYGQETDRTRSTAAGFDHYFVKPLQPQQLLELVMSVPADRYRG
ncbi:ATP-binding protein [Paraburkholderia sp. CNPSo 3274]|uniref:ATP-binding protein n=1 Tax=Paraburkholderia sp. CNPSo 3274 TaxID=2940932 RepID=UPI0020B8F037|nr:ATP-binding protein [Paraburkholderia sp. CNPSo 3274]MCP3711540.1 ATP-binding protein [Paraburkholderia sp. CNPSo 3274]